MINQTLNIRLTALKTGRVIHEMLKDIAPTFPIVVEAKTPAPYITYRRTSSQSDDTKDLTFRKSLWYEVLIVSNSYDESISKVQDCWEKLDRFRGEIAGLDIDEIRVTNSQEGFNIDDNTFIQSLTVNIKVLTR